MLVLTRKVNQQIQLGDQIKVTVLQINKGSIRIGIEAPKDVRVLRSEIPRHDGDSKPASVTGEQPALVPFATSKEPFTGTLPTGNESEVSSGVHPLHRDAMEILELDLDALVAEQLEELDAIDDFATDKVTCEATRDGEVYQTRIAAAPLARFMRGGVKETPVAYSF